MSRVITLAKALAVIEQMEKVFDNGRRFAKGGRKVNLSSYRQTEKAKNYERNSGVTLATSGYGYCLLGAKDEAARSIAPNDASVTKLVEDKILKNADHGGGGIPGFNDNPKTTFGDVKEVLVRSKKQLAEEIAKAAA